MKIAITILAVALGLGVVLAVWFASPPPARYGPETARTAAEMPGAPPPRDQIAGAARGLDEAPAAPPRLDAPAPQTPAVERVPAVEPLLTTGPETPAAEPSHPALDAGGGMRIRLPEESRSVILGSHEPGTPYHLQAQIVRWGAAVGSVTLADYTITALNPQPYAVVLPVEAPGDTRYALAARAITIEGRRIDLQALEARAQASLWALEEHSEGSATYRLTVEDAQGRPLVEVVRRYTLPQGSFDLQLQQRLNNRAGRPLRVVWEQNGPGDAPADEASYMGDRREIVAGYFDPGYNPTRRHIYTKNAFLLRYTILKELEAGPWRFWPNPDVPAQAELVWTASLNRYFASVVHRPVPTPIPTPVPALQSLFPHIDVEVIGTLRPGQDTRAVMVTLTTAPMELEAEDSAELDLAFYAGPRDSRIFALPALAALGLDQLVLYQMTGGICGMCTFQWLAHGLLWFLRFIHDWVVFDWGVAIIVLVLVVRGLLHPLMRKSQISMTRMSKLQAAIKPEVEKLKKKYAGDPGKLNAETMRLWREHGLSPFSMAGGCLPMLLQMPIWIALYAMLYYAIDLRHAPAFYGVFQKLTFGGQPWAFLADLSVADNFIRFPGAGFTLPLYFINPHFAGINIIPILMAVVTYYQQKLTMPPPADEQQRQQQAIMKWMPLMIPVFLYSAPSGLTLYIAASTFGGIIDGWIVRRHIKREEAAGTLFKKKEPRPGSLSDRIGKWMAHKQQQMAEVQKRAEQQRQRQPGQQPPRAGR